MRCLLELKWVSISKKENESESVSCSVLADSASLLTAAHKVPLPWHSPGENTGEVAVPSSRGSSQPRD